MDSSKVEAICKMPRMYYLPAEQYNNNCYGLRDMMNEISKPDWYMVEIGSFCGVSSMLFAEYCERVFCIDPYEAYSELNAKKIGIAEMMFKDNTRNYLNIDLIKVTSIQGTKVIGDNSCDMVYVDGAHDVFSVEADLLAWIPKIKNGGWICGHDINIDVRLAVEKVIGTNYKTYSDTSWAFQINR
jgi:predicted O-methyltransferase YrrM